MTNNLIKKKLNQNYLKRNHNNYTMTTYTEFDTAQVSNYKFYAKDGDKNTILIDGDYPDILLEHVYVQKEFNNDTRKVQLNFTSEPVQNFLTEIES